MLQLARPEDREAVNAIAKQVHDQHVSWRPDIYEMVEEMYPPERFQEAVRLRQLYVAKLNGIVVEPSTIWHDAKDPVCYSFYKDGKKASVATDLGNFDEYLVDKLKGSDILFVEANHDIHMLEVGRYPYPLKQRILGRNGHLSNERCGQLISKLMCDNLKHIYLGHLSKDNNYPDLAYESVKLELMLHGIDLDQKQVQMEVARRDSLSTLCEVC